MKCAGHGKDDIVKTILEMLEEDSHLTAKELAVMYDKEEGDIRRMIDDYEQSGVILGYKTVINWERTEREYVSALIELKVIPQGEHGFNEIAERICNFPEVKSCYLMSGGFDLCLFLEGKTMRQVALFVAEKLSPLPAVTATATHFVLKTYKGEGVIFADAPQTDMREEGEV